VPPPYTERLPIIGYMLTCKRGLFVTLASVAIGSCLVALLVSAQDLPSVNDGAPHGDPPFRLEDGWIPLFNGKDLSGWHGEATKTNEWFAAKSIYWDAISAPTRLLARNGPGDRIINGVNGKTGHLISDQKFGDLEVYGEFLIPQKGNSGIYLQSLYEVQIFDSYGADRPLNWEDCGAIPTRGKVEKGFTGSPPRINASRPPGEWQSYQIWFRAPRFNAAGAKIENARFLRVLHNGIVIQETVEVDGGTLGHLEIPEASMNSLLLQGDHGPVAYRNLYVRPLRPIAKRSDH
jgi:hypothetical protein